MKNPAYSFRAVDEWKSVMMNLPSFIELMRSVFGNISTPYNKQKLMDDLMIFLSRDDIRGNITAYIDGEDRKIIAATAFLNDPTPEELDEFLSSEKNSVTLRGNIMNLEERLILFRFIDENGTRRFALNPVLEPVLSQVAAETAILFPGINPEHKKNLPETSAGYEDRTLGAFIAFIMEEEDFFKTDGIKKKILDQAKKIITGIDPEAAAGALQHLGLFYADNEKFLPDSRKLKGFAELSPAGRQEYIAAGLYLHINESNNGLPRNQIHSIAALIHKFCRFLDPSKIYPEITLRRILMYLDQERTGSVWTPPEKLKPSVFFQSLEAAGIMSKTEADGFMEQLWRYMPVKLSENRGPVIAMDSPFTLILYPGISFAEILALTAFSGVKDETPFSFEITRKSAVRGFDSGLSSRDMLKTLAHFSGNSPDESLEWTLKDWESRYNSVTLHEGLILGLSPDRQHLAETGPVASMILRKLAPGLMLLSGTRADAAAALERAGVDIVAKPGKRQEGSGTEGRPYFSRNEYLGLGADYRQLFASRSDQDNTSNTAGETVKNRFKEYLGKLRIPQQEKDELSSRIDRRLILTKTQLDKSGIKPRKLEARGLDYIGKAAIVKQALSDGSLLEVTFPDPEKGVSVKTGAPSALEKKEGENVLLLKLPDDESVRIPLGKISLIRLIKQSIFNN